MTVMWIFQRLIRCLIRRKVGEHRGTWGKDASRGGGGWKPLPSAPLAPMPETTSAACLPALNLLFDPRAVHFQTAHYQVLLQHWSQLGWVKQWRQGKAVVFGLHWGTILALPRPIYDPGCQPSHEGLILNSRNAKAASVAANVAKPAAQSAPTASVGAPIEAPTAASHFRDAMGAVHKQAPVLHLRYGACLFRLIFRSPALISRDQCLIFEPPVEMLKVKG